MSKSPTPLPNPLLALLMRSQRVSRRDDGFIVFLTLAVVLMLGFLWMASALMSKIDTASVDASETSNSGFYAAEFGLNRRAKEVRNTFEGYNVPMGVAPVTWKDCVDGLSGNDGTGDFRCQTDTVKAARWARAAQRVITFVQETGANPTSTLIPNGEPFAGLSALEYSYDVTSVARNSQDLPSAMLSMQFKSRLIPLFQFAVFYDEDADFTIPPNMTVNGRIHSNGNLYVNASSSATLSIDGQISTVGELVRGEKSNQSQQCTGQVRVKKANGGAFQNLNCNGNVRTRYNKNTTTPSNVSDWEDRMVLGISPLAVPPPEAMDAAAPGEYWMSADLRLVLNVANDATNPVSGTRVTGIEVQNIDGSLNAAATNTLRSCSALDLAGNPISTTIQSAASDSTLNTVQVTNNTANQFRVGDPLIIGDDWDSNVVTGPFNGGAGNPNAVNVYDVPATAGNLNLGVPPSLDNDVATTSDTITLRQRLREAVNRSAGLPVRKAVVFGSDTFYNYREKYAVNGTVRTGGNAGRYVRMLNVDVRELLNCLHNNPTIIGGKTLDDTTEGGLVWYLTVKGPNSTVVPTATTNPNNYGVRLYNGRYLASTLAGAPEIQGLTVVSDQAVYIQGDYNLKNDATTGTVATIADDPRTARIERWRPAAIMADSINIISNRGRLDDFNSTVYNTATKLPAPQDTTSGKLVCKNTISTGWCDIKNMNTFVPVTQADIDAQTHRPAAKETWVNAAFLGGTTSPTNEGDPSTGGVNNYPRFHEDWVRTDILATVPFNYLGSFVSLNQPRRTNAPFCGSSQPDNCNIYTPPIRNWDYDPMFNNASNLPPITPRAVYLRQEVFTRSYERASLPFPVHPLASLFSFLPSFDR